MKKSSGTASARDKGDTETTPEERRYEGLAGYKNPQVS
jgi:hypothetical protein